MTAKQSGRLKSDFTIISMKQDKEQIDNYKIKSSLKQTAGSIYNSETEALASCGHIKMTAHYKKPAILIIILLAAACLTLLVCLFGSSIFGSAENEFAIENHVWEFSLVQDNSGEIAVCSSENAPLYSDAKIDTLLLKADAGRIIINSVNSGKNWELFYSLCDKSPEGIIYEIACGEVSGYAGTGLTRYHDGKAEYTLNLSINGYAVKFTDSLFQKAG